MAREKKGETWHCANCFKKIDLKKDKFVTINTWQGKSDVPKLISEYYFHFQCWKDYFNKCVTDKAKSGVENMQKKVMGLMNIPMIKDVMSRIKGSNELLQIVGTPINQQKVIELKGKIEDLQNVRGKKRKAKRK